MEANRAFDFIAFPSTVATPEQLTGHDRLHSDRYHGFLALELTALTPVFIAAGITALGSDVGETVPLLKVMVQDQQGNPILQGTSLKGCVRAIYETITNSNIAVKSNAAQASHQPIQREGQKLNRTSKLSPAELVFGALGFQGLISIADAVGDRPLERGDLPPMYPPRQGKGRKFYFHRDPKAVVNPPSSNQSTEPEQPPSPIQQAAEGTVFTTTLRFANLTLAQLGALLVALGQDPEHRFDLKLGAGKGKGLGSIAIAVQSHQITRGDRLKADRYLSYRPSQEDKPDLLAEAIQAAHSTKLIHQEQLQSLWQILRRSEESHDN